MNENINLIDILKDAPIGTKLWSPLCGECEFRGILSSNNVFQIRVKYVEEENNTVQYLCFSLQGKYCNCSKAECLLFPSKENRDWSTFKVPKKHKHFEPFQRVLCIINDNDCKIWAADFYSHYDEDKKQHYLVSGVVVKDDDDNEIVPYGGNEDKLGKIVE